MEKTLTLVRSYLVERWNPRRRSYEWKPGFGLRLPSGGVAVPSKTLSEWRKEAAKEGAKCLVES